MKKINKEIIIRKYYHYKHLINEFIYNLLLQIKINNLKRKYNLKCVVNEEMYLIYYHLIKFVERNKINNENVTEKLENKYTSRKIGYKFKILKATQDKFFCKIIYHIINNG